MNQNPNENGFCSDGLSGFYSFLRLINNTAKTMTTANITTTASAIGKKLGVGFGVEGMVVEMREGVGGGSIALMLTSFDILTKEPSTITIRGSISIQVFKVSLIPLNHREQE